jgi:CBS domain-containing protein
MIVRHIIEQKGRMVYALPPEAPVIDAVRMMADKHVGALLVMRGEALAGIVSERDYARKVVLKGRSSSDTPVADIMTASVITVSPDDTLESCMRVVTEKRIRHLPVVDRGKVVGVVSIGDLVKHLLEEKEKTIEQLQEYIRS